VYELANEAIRNMDEEEEEDEDGGYYYRNGKKIKNRSHSYHRNRR
jgi:hypothetical protein